MSCRLIPRIGHSGEGTPYLPGILPVQILVLQFTLLTIAQQVQIMFVHFRNYICPSTQHI